MFNYSMNVYDEKNNKRYFDTTSKESYSSKQVILSIFIIYSIFNNKLVNLLWKTKIISLVIKIKMIYIIKNLIESKSNFIKKTSLNSN